MNSSFCAHQQGHLNGDNAPHPIEPRWRTPVALLLLALRSWQRRRLCRPQSSQRLAFFALSRCARAHLEPQRSPCRPQSSQRLAFFALSRCARAHLEPQRSALPAHLIAAHSGASNCGFQVDKRNGICAVALPARESHTIVTPSLRAGLPHLPKSRPLVA